MSRKVITTKPYDLQVRSDLWPEDQDIDNWLDTLSSPVLNVLVGMPKCGKSTFMKNCGLQIKGASSSAFTRHSTRYSATSTAASNDAAKEYILAGINIIDGYRSSRILRSKIDKSVSNDDSVIVDMENLTRESRMEILKEFPSRYLKVAVIWELSDEVLFARGCNAAELERKKKIYERPDSNEGFDEFVYIFS